MSEISLNRMLLRIALISTHGYVASNPPLGAADTGGQVVYVLELAKKLAQLGNEVDIWTRRFENQEEIDEVNEQVRIIRIPCGGNDFIPKEYLYESLPEWCEHAKGFIKKHDLKYQFINSHYWDAGLAGQHLADSLDTSHIHTPHSLGIWKLRQMETDFPDDKEHFDKKYNFTKRIQYERKIYKDCDLLIATTPIQMDVLTNDYQVSQTKCRMIPPGYDDNRFFPVSGASREMIRQQLGFSGKVILGIGRLALNKGYDLLINAFKVIADRVPEAKLHLAVGGAVLDDKEKELLDQLKNQVSELKLSDKVVFSNFVPDEELADYYRAADVFVLSSRYEPFGMTAIEAMACGTPTVVTTNGGLYRALTYGRHALYADPFDELDLGITIYKVLNHTRLFERLSRMGAHKVRSLFTWTGIAQQLTAAAEQHSSRTFSLKDDEWDEPWNDGD